MTATLTTPKISAVDYFAAKLAYEMTPWTLKRHLEAGMKEHFLLDVRSKEDYAAGRIPGATSIPLTELPNQLAKLPKGKTIVAYCGNMLCGLAPKAALLLAEKGYPVMTLAGGVATWQEKGFPLEK
jgi:rhodanese-related sulfurtransferase